MREERDRHEESIMKKFHDIKLQNSIIKTSTPHPSTTTTSHNQSSSTIDQPIQTMSPVRVARKKVPFPYQSTFTTPKLEALSATKIPDFDRQCAQLFHSCAPIGM
jgi:hypothetical protein